MAEVQVAVCSGGKRVRILAASSGAAAWSAAVPGWLWFSELGGSFCRRRGRPSTMFLMKLAAVPAPWRGYPGHWGPGREAPFEIVYKSRIQQPVAAAAWNGEGTTGCPGSRGSDRADGDRACRPVWL